MRGAPAAAAVWASAVVAASACAPRTPPAPPMPAALARPDWHAVTAYLDSAVAAGAAPGAVLGVSVGGRRFFYGTGRLGQDDATRPDSGTIYDLASVTKVVALTTLAMMAVDEGRLDLDAPIQRYVPEFQGHDKERVTVRHLLTHSSGLPPFRLLYRETATREEALALTDTTALDTVPGAREVYSDLGIIVLTQAIERLFGSRIDTLFAERVAGPLGLSSMRYLPPASWIPRIAPTEDDPWRGRVLRGEVHDENTARLGGVSGHAGLFSDALDLVRFGEWIAAGLARPAATLRLARAIAPAPPAPPRSLAAFAVRQDLVPGSSRALGWDTPSGVSSGGSHIARTSIGHTGFTGTSIWIDPTRDLVIVLLSNRVHPTRANDRWRPVRGHVADLVFAALFPDAS
jgi:CubicO group peptidase (beta-lactamase class C family)